MRKNCKKCDILFFIEHEDREGASVQRIKKELENIGKKVIVLSLEFHAFLFNKFDPLIVIIPYGFSKEQWPINALIEIYPNARVVNLNWEQLLTPINQHFKKPRDDYFRDKVIHLCWSDEFKNFLIENQVDESNIFVSGNVSYELLEEECGKQIEFKSDLSKKYGLNCNAKWIFLPLNYAWAFISDAEIEGKIRKGYDPVNAWVYKEYASKCLVRFLYFLQELSLKHPEYQFIIRPHPSISCEQYNTRTKDLGISMPKNVTFTKELTIREWIIASDIVGSSWSSSVWDAVNSGKKGFLFTPYEKPDWHTVWWEKYVINYKSVDQVDFNKLNLLSRFTEKNKYGKASENVCSLLIDLLSEKNNFELCGSKIFPRKSIKLRLRELRSIYRYISVKYFRGIGVKKGLIRDFFEPML